jgi:hypothetical protein
VCSEQCGEIDGDGDWFGDGHSPGIDSGRHAVLGTEEVAGIRRPGLRRIDWETFAQAYPNARLTERGDVLVTMTPRPAAMVDRDGFGLIDGTLTLTSDELSGQEE